MAALLVKAPVLAGGAGPVWEPLESVADLGREPNFGSLETMVGMVGGLSRGGADIRPRPLHHGDTEQEELERKETDKKKM